MGAWGHANFENDSALDFVWEVQETGASRIVEAILQINNFPADGYLETDDCTHALAAMEFIATARGNSSPDFPESAEEWMNANPGAVPTGATLVSESQKAINRIQNNSELKELWEEGDEFNNWKAVLEDLRNRISA